MENSTEQNINTNNPNPKVKGRKESFEEFFNRNRTKDKTEGISESNAINVNENGAEWNRRFREFLDNNITNSQKALKLADQVHAYITNPTSIHGIDKMTWISTIGLKREKLENAEMEKKIDAGDFKTLEEVQEAVGIVENRMRKRNQTINDNEEKKHDPTKEKMDSIRELKEDNRKDDALLGRLKTKKVSLEKLEAGKEHFLKASERAGLDNVKVKDREIENRLDRAMGQDIKGPNAVELQIGGASANGSFGNHDTQSNLAARPKIEDVVNSKNTPEEIRKAIDEAEKARQERPTLDVVEALNNKELSVIKREELRTQLNIFDKERSYYTNLRAALDKKLGLLEKKTSEKKPSLTARIGKFLSNLMATITSFFKRQPKNRKTEHEKQESLDNSQMMNSQVGRTTEHEVTAKPPIQTKESAQGVNRVIPNGPDQKMEWRNTVRASGGEKEELPSLSK